MAAFPKYLVHHVFLFFGPGFPGAGSSSAPCRGPTPGEATNQSVEAVCALLCSTTHTCSTYLYQDPASFASSSGINFGGNCVLRDRFEDGGYLNEVQDTGGYQAKHCIRWNPAAPRSKSFFASPRDIDVSQDALEKGFNVTIDIPSSKARRFFLVKHVAPYGQENAEYKCAEAGGTLPLEYNDEVSDLLLSAIGSDLPQERYMGLRVRKDDSGPSYRSVWQNGLVDWTEADQLGGGESCPRYPDWMDDPLSEPKRFLKFNSSSGEYHLGNITPQPTLLVCQYFGRNLAEGRPVGFRAQRSGWPAHRTVNGLWGSGGTYHGATHDWLAIDLGPKSYAVKAFMFSTRRDCCGYRHTDVSLLVGSKMPKNGTPVSHLELEKFIPCAEWPYVGQNGEVTGATCDCLAVGTVALILNRGKTPSQSHMQFMEVGVYGVPWDKFVG